MTKLLLTSSPRREVGLVVNMARDASEGLLVARQLTNAVQQFLGSGIKYYGHIDRDPYVADAVQAQRPLMSSDVDSPAAEAYRRLARRVITWTPPTVQRAAPAEPSVRLGVVDLMRTEARSCA